MPWPFQSQRPQPDHNPKPKKRVSFAPDQPTGCPPPPQQNAKQVRFTSDTKPGSRNRSAGSSKTRWPSPPTSTPATKAGAPGLSSVGRDFETKKPALKTSKPSSKSPRASGPPKSSRPPRAAKPDARVSIPINGNSCNGPPKPRHQRPGYEWVSYEIRVKPTAKDWRKERWAK